MSDLLDSVFVFGSKASLPVVWSRCVFCVFQVQNDFQ